MEKNVYERYLEYMASAKASGHIFANPTTEEIQKAQAAAIPIAAEETVEAENENTVEATGEAPVNPQDEDKPRRRSRKDL